MTFFQIIYLGATSLLILLGLPAGASEKPLHVLVDPGHGGTDQGATRGAIKESKISLQVSTLLQKILENDPRFKVSLTRTSDKFVSLKARVDSIEKNQADIFLSIHANSSIDRRAKGVEFYFQNQLPADEETLYLAATENRMEKIEGAEKPNSLPSDSVKLVSTDAADDEPTKKNDVLAILEDLKRQTRMSSSLRLSDKMLAAWSKNSPDNQMAENNIIRQAPFYVVAKASVPSVLVELGFITNPKEADRLIDPAYQKIIAERIYQGLSDYKEMMDKTELGPLKSSP